MLHQGVGELAERIEVLLDNLQTKRKTASLRILLFFYVRRIKYVIHTHHYKMSFSTWSPQKKRTLSFLLVAGIVVLGLGLGLSVGLGPKLPILGSRKDLPVLPGDDKVHYIAYQNPQNKKYFLRVAMQNPNIDFGFMCLVSTPEVKAVHFIAKGTSSVTGKTAFRTIQNVKHLPAPDVEGWPFKEYVVLRPMIVPDKAKNGEFFASIQWASFDLELTLPASDVYAQRRVFSSTAFSSSLYRISLEVVDRVGTTNSNLLDASVDAILPIKT